MKDIKIELNASNASGEAYWRKRCDVVEAELARLHAEFSRVDAILSEVPFYGQEELSEASPADGIRNYRDAVEAELTRLRAEVEILVWNLAGISTMACRRTPILYNGEMARPALDDVAELVKDYDRLCSENERMREALKRIAAGVDCPEGVIERPDFYASQEYFERVANEALSRAEQAEQKPETCVWATSIADTTEWITSCTRWYRKTFHSTSGACPNCGRAIEVQP